MDKKYIYSGLVLVAAAVFIAIFFMQKDKSVVHYAEKFCTCSTDLSELEAQKANGRVSAAHYETAKKDFEKCLGTNKITFEVAADSIKFYDALVITISKKCPNEAKNMGFKF